MTRLARWWFAPAPAERLAAMRILIGGYALAYTVGRTAEIARVSHYGASQFHPIGIVRVLEAPLPPSVVLAIALAAAALLAGFVVGVGYRVVAPLAAAALLWTISYGNSWGQLFHTENLLVLHVIALACAPAADAWAVPVPGRRRTPRGPKRDPSAGYGWAIKLLAALTAATYLLAGVAKLRVAGLDWLDGELLRNHIAVDNLRKALLGDPLGPLARWFLEHPAPLVVFCVLTLVIELGAPVALVGRRLGYGWAVAAWGFHVGVLLLMNISFPYPLVGMAFLPLMPAERVIEVARGIGRRFAR